MLHPAGAVRFLPPIVEISTLSIATCQLTSADPHNLATLRELQEVSTNHPFRDNEESPNEELPNIQSPIIAETFQSNQYSTNSLQEAWDAGNIACYHDHTLTSRRRFQYKFLFPTLTHTDCCFPHSNWLVTVGDNNYVDSNQNTTQWYDGNFIFAFSSLAAYYVRQSVSERLGDFPAVDIPTLLHVIYPRQQLQRGEYNSLPLHINCVVAVFHNNDHYVVMEVNPFLPTRHNFFWRKNEKMAPVHTGPSIHPTLF
jgi:hypothetical protein